MQVRLLPGQATKSAARHTCALPTPWWTCCRLKIALQHSQPAQSRQWQQSHTAGQEGVCALKTGCHIQVAFASLCTKHVWLYAGPAKIFQAECAVASTGCVALLQGSALLSGVAPGVCPATIGGHCHSCSATTCGVLAGAVVVACVARQLRAPAMRCRYWHSGRCLYGDHCRFAHPATPAPAAPPATQPVCRYWRFGTCRYGPACRFR